MSDDLTPDTEHVLYRHPRLRHGASDPLDTLVVSSIEVDRTETHSSMAVFNRGGYSGTLTVLRDDEALIAKRLFGTPLNETQDGFAITCGLDEGKFLMMLLAVGTVAISDKPTHHLSQSITAAQNFAKALGHDRVTQILMKLIELSILIRDEIPEERGA